eukprot:gene30601-27211_t
MRGVAAAGPVMAWDVVNEAVDTRGLKHAAPWYPAVPDYIDIAFRAARAADPSALLFYNDYGADMVNAKSTVMYNMVKSMKDRNVPIDGVGLQMHLRVTDPPQALGTSVAQNIARFGALGLQVHITELDVKCPDPCDDAKQAAVYASVLRACLSSPACTVFQTWGFTDKVSWLNGVRCKLTPSATPSATTPCHALPFDEHYAAKPAAAAM